MTRKAWFWVISGYVVMAAGFLVVLFILNSHINTVRRTQRQAATIAVHNAGAICLGLTAPTKNEEMAIIDAFLKGDGTVVSLFTPTCKMVARKAGYDIFGQSNLPPELNRELAH